MRRSVSEFVPARNPACVHGMIAG